MDHDAMKQEETYTFGSGGCCSGPGKWIWILLLLAVAGVMIAKNSGTKFGDEASAMNEPLLAVEPDVIVPTSESAPQGQSLPRLVDLGADTCTPCRRMLPILDDFKDNYAEHFGTEFIDVWKDPAAGKKYGINVIPTQIFFDADGKELFRHEGFFVKEEMLKKWQEFGIAPPAQASKE